MQARCAAMKFAKRLSAESNVKYAGYYVAYKHLKKQLKCTLAEQSSLTTVLLDSAQKVF
jgi:SPX domain protein involved in polyphosphate accumulation